MEITATIIAYNEEKDILDCIKSAQKICDEVIVVLDSKTTDNTGKIAQEAGALVFTVPYQGDGPQKAWAVDKAKNDWIFSMDADERLGDDLIDYLRTVDLKKTPYDAFAFRRKNYVGQKLIKAPGFYPDYVVRLYHRKRAKYLPLAYHSYVSAKKIKKIRAHIIHYTYDSYADWLQKLKFHSEKAAQSLYLRGKKTSPSRAFLHGILAFFKQYIYQGGFLYGFDGFTVALTTFFATYFKYLMLWEMNQKPKEKLKKEGDLNDGP